MVVPAHRRIPNPKNSQYLVRDDGSLLCGPGCFSSANILKRRFESRIKAEKWIRANSNSYTHPGMKSYLCEYCKGAHITSKETK